MDNERTRKKILLVDDDHEDQEIFCEVLGQVNDLLDCLCVDTAEDALQTLSKATDHPQYIFLDLNLPYMNGFDCLHKLKAEPQYKNIPVIIYSTSSRSSDKQKAIELGAYNFISKPNTMDELKVQLQSIL